MCHDVKETRPSLVQTSFLRALVASIVFFLILFRAVSLGALCKPFCFAAALPLAKKLGTQVGVVLVVSGMDTGVFWTSSVVLSAAFDGYHHPKRICSDSGASYTVRKLKY